MTTDPNLRASVSPQGLGPPDGSAPALVDGGYTDTNTDPFAPQAGRPLLSLRRLMLVRLVLPVAGVLLLLATLVIGLGFRPLLGHNAQMAFAGEAGRVVDALDRMATTSRRSLQAAQVWWQRNEPVVDDPRAFNEFFWPLLASDPMVTSVVAGTTTGQGWLLLQLPNDRWRNRLSDVPRWGQDQRIVMHDPDGVQHLSVQAQDYDARQRPWYQVAMALKSTEEVAWTPPYTFFTTGDAGITASMRLKPTQLNGAHGAVGLDLKLQDLSAVTMNLRVGQRGMTLVLADDERVLAMPRAPDGVDRVDWVKKVLQPVQRLDLPAVTAAVAEWSARGRQALETHELQVGGALWLVTAQPYPLGAQRLWVFTLAPSTDFGPDWRMMLALLVAGLLVLMGPLVWLARAQARVLAQPLEVLVRASERIGQLEFDQTTAAQLVSPVREMQQLAQSHERMRSLLQDHQRELSAQIHALEKAQGEIHQLAFFDPLTQLPNRRLFMDRLRQAQARSQRSGQTGALLFIDLDNFKTLNDTLGHAAGDTLLQVVGRRLVGGVRQTDTVSRFGGDEFLVMLEDLVMHAGRSGPTPASDAHQQVARSQALAVAQKLLHDLSQPAQILHTEYITTPSIGVVMFSGAEPVDDLLKWADMAMYQAKAAGRNNVCFFNPDFQAQAEHRVQLESDLRVALRKGQFQMWLQPQFNAQRQLVGAEALLRWPHPVRGWVGPVEFIPVAEASGLIVVLGQWVLEQACAQLARWAQEPAMAQLTLSVNVSARQFRHPDFVSHTLEVLQRTGAKPALLRLELTESMLLDDVQQTIERMAALRDLGIGFSLDDFGTGYSSLSYLKRLPFVELKIDKSFVRDMTTDPSDAVLTHTMVVLAHALGLGVLAEGVETEAQFAALAQSGCDLFQGYLLGKPASVQDFQQRWMVVG